MSLTAYQLTKINPVCELTQTRQQQLFTMVRNIIIDTDPGVDDAMAIMMALEAHVRGQISIKAFTLAFGNATIENCIQNLGAILSFYPPECLEVSNIIVEFFHLI